ncbi:hypothetical protein SAMD00019534_002960 [Acytostelium subglobosum LB1]|uniref:hypothetical protein n=1 Tax=Acytostelium subglobosum LB1 TaxID=1410327 RepID=UPI000644EBE8|nr:hypothetical protein SAMD00019534_002960 [Acytostelium subglobosum LB1]GAM17121.1 hypothetical protein SAMD00019534_002960 [Acytostelium subglobosum LB1]|eukprot:XP_012759183.1 hypothetical protein SAMD00019534_002960 [Acytostelium subglobosum LB1]
MDATSALALLNQKFPVADSIAGTKCERAIKWELTIGDDLSPHWNHSIVCVSIEKTPFAKGSCRTAHKLKDWSKPGMELVGKFSSNKKTTRDSYFTDVLMQTFCSKWAEKFNESKPPKPITFLPTYVYELLDHPPPYPVCGGEPFIAGEYKKHNNNSGYVNSESRNTPQAFSHFSYENSNHELLIVDIQGVNDFYTDPQIHTKNGQGFGEGNLGETGFHKFLQSHKCNAVCDFLKLQQINQSKRTLLRGTLPVVQLMEFHEAIGINQQGQPQGAPSGNYDMAYFQSGASTPVSLDDEEKQLQEQLERIRAQQKAKQAPVPTPQVSAPQVAAPQVAAPHVSAPHVTAPHVAVPQVVQPPNRPISTGVSVKPAAAVASPPVIKPVVLSPGKVVSPGNALSAHATPNALSPPMNSPHSNTSPHVQTAVAQPSTPTSSSNASSSQSSPAVRPSSVVSPSSEAGISVPPPSRPVPPTPTNAMSTPPHHQAPSPVSKPLPPPVQQHTSISFEARSSPPPQSIFGSPSPSPSQSHGPSHPAPQQQQQQAQAAQLPDKASSEKWDLKNTRNLDTIRGLQSECMVGNESRMFTGSNDGNLGIWDADQMKHISNVKAHGKSIRSVALSAKGTLLTGGADSYIKEWDLNTMTMLKEIKDSNEINSVFIQDNLMFTGSNDKTVKIWDMRTYQCTQTLQGHTRAIKAVCALGNLMFSGSNDQQIFVWSLQNNRVLTNFQGHEGWVKSLYAHNNTLYSASHDETVKVWDLKTTKCTNTLKCKDRVESVMVTNQGIFAGAGDYLQIFDTASHDPLATINTRSSILCLWRKQNKLFTGSLASNLKVWTWDTL